jgi:hypothetical protein
LDSVRAVDYKIATMYDALKSRYTFTCPRRGEASVRLSSFRRLDRLPGTAHPAVFRVTFSCPCGDEHVGLVPHEQLDWEPLGLGGGRFLNLMTSRYDDLEAEFADQSLRHIQAGAWPWAFYCYPEGRPRPVFPSSFQLLAPESGQLGMAVRCPVCSMLSVNLVSSEHVDVPFHNDREVGVVVHTLMGETLQTPDELVAELESAPLDIRALAL